MLKENVNDLLSFMVVARERSFTAQRPSSACHSRRSAMPCAISKRVSMCGC